MIGLFTPNYNTGSSRFCGPTAIMAVTGEPGSVVRDAIRQSRGDIRSRSGAHMPVMGVNNDDLLAAMRLLGWTVVQALRQVLKQLLRRHSMQCLEVTEVNHPPRTPNVPRR